MHPKRILSWKQALCQPLGDYDGATGLVGILFIEEPPSAQRQADCVEVLRTDDPVMDKGCFPAAEFNLTLHAHAGAEQPQRWIVHDAGGFHAWQHSHPGEKLLKEIGQLLW